MKIKWGCLLLACLTVVLVSNCARGGDRNNRPGGTQITDREFRATEAEAQARLKEIVREQILAGQQTPEAKTIPIIRRRPYYFREYAVYPDGPEDFEIEFREVDSRTRPLMSEVRLNKIRYSTRMHRKYDRAAADTNFLRDTGVEVLVYEWHNGRWTRTGAIFNAQKTEEQIDGVWQPRRDEIVRVDPAAEQPGWFGRMWERIRGGE